MSIANLKLRPAQLVTLLAAAIPAHEPILITGAPGVGKSDIVAQAARAAGADLIISHPAVADPTDFKGLPWPDAENESARFLPFGEFADALVADSLTTWFFDDLGQASNAVQAAAMQLLLARRVNSHVLPDCVGFVACTNARQHKAGVTGILEPVKSRFMTIVELETSLDDWVSWAYGAHVDPMVIAFLRFRPELLSQFVPTPDLTNSPSPRTWHAVARALSLGLPDEILHPVVAGAVGAGAAAEFMGFRAVFDLVPSIDDVLLDPLRAPIPTDPSALYAVSVMAAKAATLKTFGRLMKYAHRLPAEFFVLFARDAVRQDRALTMTSAWGEFINSDEGKRVSGAQ